MWTKERALIFLTALQMAPFASADNDHAGTTSYAPLPETSMHTWSHTNYLNKDLNKGLNKDWLSAEEKSSATEPVLHSQVESTSGNTLSSGSSGSSGVTPADTHWMWNTGHPALEYRFNDDTSVRMHVGRHGVTTNATWHF